MQDETYSSKYDENKGPDGYENINLLGYTVSEPSCGATIKLYSLRGNGTYAQTLTTSEGERQYLIDHEHYKDEGVDSYVWSLVPSWIDQQ